MMLIFCFFISIFLSSSDYEVKSSSFHDLSANIDGGSAIRFDDTAKSILVMDCNIKNCTSNSMSGGAIYIDAARCGFAVVCGINCMSHMLGSKGQFAFILTEEDGPNYFNYTTIYECGTKNYGIQAYYLNNNNFYSASYRFDGMNASNCRNNVDSSVYFSSICHIENVNAYYSYATITNNTGNSLFSYYLTEPIIFNGINIMNNTVRYGFNFGGSQIELSSCCYFGNKDNSGKNNLASISAAIIVSTSLTVLSSFFDRDVSHEKYVNFTGGSVVTTTKTSLNIIINDKQCNHIYPTPLPSETNKFTQSQSFTSYIPPTSTFTPSDQPYKNYRAIIEKKEEAKFIAKSAGITVGISVFIIIGGVLLMIIYLRIKTKKRLLNSLDSETETQDTHTTDYSYSYSYFYSYYSYYNSYSVSGSYHMKEDSNILDEVSISFVSIDASASDYHD